MSLPHMSIATIKSPEFINLEPLDISPFMSKCEIKVFYLGENRNGTYINEETAREMAKTLRGCPIVGAYREEKEDFTDHGEQIILDSEGIRFNCLTKPYGFVSPTADVWFQEFEDEDEFKNKIIRKYMMTTGYLWTEQYPEAKQAIVEGKPQSMELDRETVDGHWSTNSANGLDFFIITDAIFSKLCILGDDVEPCFEGASVTAPQISSTFSLDANFKNTLFNMMKQLQYVLKGEENMDLENKDLQVSEEATATPEEDFACGGGSDDEKKNYSIDETVDEGSVGEGEEAVTEDESEKTEPAGEPVVEEEAAKEEETEEPTAEEESELDGDPEADFTVSKEQYEELQCKYAELEKVNAELLAFKEGIENERKDALIAEFYMLSDEDKKDVIANKATYSYDEIKSKLAVIAYDLKVGFEQNSDQNFDNNIENNLILTNFTVNDDDVSTPEWVKAVEDTANNM